MQPIADDIQRFLALHRIALVGVSRHETEFSRTVARAFLERGYDVAFVHSGVDELFGHRTFPTVAAITPPVEGALLMTPPAVTATVARECAAVGIPMVWMYRGAGHGAVDLGTVQELRARGVAVIAGACPFMFWPQAGFIHRVHGFFSRGGVMRRACASQAEPPLLGPPAAPPGQPPSVGLQ